MRCKGILLDIFSLLLYRELNGPCILFDFYSGHDVSLVFVNITIINNLIVIIVIILTRCGTCCQPAGSTPRSCSSSTWTRTSSSREETRLLSSSCPANFPFNPCTLHIWRISPFRNKCQKVTSKEFMWSKPKNIYLHNKSSPLFLLPCKANVSLLFFPSPHFLFCFSNFFPPFPFQIFSSFSFFSYFPPTYIIPLQDRRTENFPSPNIYRLCLFQIFPFSKYFLSPNISLLLLFLWGQNIFLLQTFSFSKYFPPFPSPLENIFFQTPDMFLLFCLQICSFFSYRCLDSRAQKDANQLLWGIPLPPTPKKTAKVHLKWQQDCIWTKTWYRSWIRGCVCIIWKAIVSSRPLPF